MDDCPSVSARINVSLSVVCSRSARRRHGAGDVRRRAEPRRRRAVASRRCHEELHRVHEVLRTQDVRQRVSELCCRKLYRPTSSDNFNSSCPMLIIFVQLLLSEYVYFSPHLFSVRTLSWKNFDTENHINLASNYGYRLCYEVKMCNCI